MKSKNIKKMIQLGICGIMAVTLLTATSPSGVEAAFKEQASYRTVTEVYDWGAAVSKVIVDLGDNVTANAVDNETFKVYAKRVLAEGATTPKQAMQVKNKISLGSEAQKDTDLEGYREVTKAYVSDATGKAVNKGRYVTIELKVGPDIAIGSALNFDVNSFFNNWVKPEYTITQTKDAGSVKGLIVDNNKGNVRPVVDKFNYAHKIFGRLSYGYASYEPKDAEKHPLIIWLHGMGEGGTDSPSIPISANKADMFADDSLQSHFGGAYVLVPQARTYWMHGFKDFGDGTSIYEDSLKQLIDAYAAEHPNVDRSRIYIGGDSNGGYMTMLMIRDYPEYFAAAFPTCEGLADKLISDADIESFKKTPIWFTAAKTDTTLPPKDYVVPTFNRLQAAGAENVHFSFFDNVVDQTGLYKKADGSAYEYPGHWSWIYVYNDKCVDNIDGKTVKLMDWLAAQKR
jgi:predicted peptidase